MQDFTGQHIIVTGGTRGIGRGITEGFLQAGATVVATYTSNDQAAQELALAVADFPGQLDLRKFDVSNVAEVGTFFQYIEDRYPAIDVLVNNSGIRRDAVMALMSDEEWSQVLAVNLNGTFFMTRKIIPIMMKKRYGRIVNISSVGAELGLPGQANYAASKAAQVAMSKTLAKEVGKKGITVNSLCPGFIETELLADLTPEQKKTYTSQVPLRRFGKIQEVVHGVLFLASREASYISGTSLNISGGL